MSHTLDRLTFFRRQTETFSKGHGVLNDEDRTWEEAYRNRWRHDKIVRSTHGVNCTGSCSWKIYVKGGIVTWETQQTDYPRTRDDLPNHEPRGCSRGASYSWYLYSANRVKYPLIRARLLKAWREDETERLLGPVLAAMQRHYQATAHAGVERLLRRELTGLGDEQRDAVERWAAALARRFAHLPASGLRAVVRDHGGEALDTFLSRADDSLGQALREAREDPS